MEKVSTLSFDALDCIGRSVRTFLYELTLRLSESPISLDGYHVPLHIEPFCWGDYRCDELFLCDGAPAMKVSFANEEVTCTVPLRTLDFPDIISFMETVSRIDA